MTVALEHTGQPPPDKAAPAVIGELDFVTPKYDDQGNIIGFISLLGADTQLRFGRVQEEEGQEADVNITRASPGEANQVFIQFNYEDMVEGQLFVIKIYNNGQESPGLRLVEEWTLGKVGEAALPLTPGTQFTLAPGEYRVEVYVDSHLIQEGKFTIEESGS